MHEHFGFFQAVNPDIGPLKQERTPFSLELGKGCRAFFFKESAGFVDLGDNGFGSSGGFFGGCFYISF